MATPFDDGYVEDVEDLSSFGSSSASESDYSTRTVETRVPISYRAHPRIRPPPNLSNHRDNDDIKEAAIREKSSSRRPMRPPPVLYNSNDDLAEQRVQAEPSIPQHHHQNHRSIRSPPSLNSQQSNNSNNVDMTGPRRDQEAADSVFYILRLTGVPRRERASIATGVMHPSDWMNVIQEANDPSLRTKTAATLRRLHDKGCYTAAFTFVCIVYSPDSDHAPASFPASVLETLSDSGHFKQRAQLCPDDVWQKLKLLKEAAAPRNPCLYSIRVLLQCLHTSKWWLALDGGAGVGDDDEDAYPLPPFGNTRIDWWDVAARPYLPDALVPPHATCSRVDAPDEYTEFLATLESSAREATEARRAEEKEEHAENSQENVQSQHSAPLSLSLSVPLASVGKRRAEDAVDDEALALDAAAPAVVAARSKRSK